MREMGFRVGKGGWRWFRGESGQVERSHDGSGRHLESM